MQNYTDLEKMDYKTKVELAKTTQQYEILDALSVYKDIQAEVAKNINVSYETLFKLSKSQNWVVVDAVANNKKCTENLLNEIVLFSDNFYVLTSVVFHKNTSKKTLEYIFKKAEMNNYGFLIESTLDKLKKFH